MTVGSQVKSCFASIKSAEATLMLLAQKTQDDETKQTLTSAQHTVSEIKDDLQKHVLFLSREEPQYKP